MSSRGPGPIDDGVRFGSSDGVDLNGRALSAVTHVGRRREKNEDAVLVCPAGPLLVVSDGMGGHPAGELASALAANAVAQEMNAPSEGPTGERLLRAVHEAQRRVLQEADARPSCRGMGTTLVAARIDGDVLFTCHVGDSRCYVKRGPSLVRLTNDHSLVGAMVTSGALTAEEARTHPRRSILIQAIGLSAGIEPESHRRNLEPGDIVLLCSDGLWEDLPDSEILAVLEGPGTLGERTRRLVERANALGGTDNITVAAWEMEPAS